ncbi:MAG: ERF family protein [Armatimonadota bacterium]
MSVAAKINQVMKKVSNLSKDKQVQGGGNYAYLSEEKIVSALHNACTECGLVFAPLSMEILENREDTTRNGGILHCTRILVTYQAIDKDDGDNMIIQALGEGSDSGDKTLSKCMTSAYKYALRQTFMITTGKEEADQEASQESTQSQRTAPQSQQSQRSSGRIPAAIVKQIRDLRELKGLGADAYDAVKKELGLGDIQTDDLTPPQASTLMNRMKKLPDAKAA